MWSDDMVSRLAEGTGVPTGEEQDLRQILVAMQHSLTQIDGKIDSLSYRMNRMTERLDKHAERLDQSERRVSELLGRTTFPDLFVVERAHCSLAARLPPGAPPRPLIASLLNNRAWDAALRRARELKTLQYEGMVVSLYPDFTLQVQEVRRQFIAGKKQLRELRLEYRMLYPAKLTTKSLLNSSNVE
ncbi:hypothetical protein NDU88_004950 [Pleurodeles waltl]|uniref:Uncharacterized protein n=1 Tax=Pleurodeles waltl TaxID=8319 RepID=A0AAV7VLT1_PLEWA|nr:hypothetical protein NDU88_004950 [Pleurodeles waltl]